jgi:succinyl-diaminopimelate desuccinylase
MSGDKERILDRISASEGLVVELESLLTPIQAMAPESGGTGEWEKARVLEAWLKARGIADIERHDAPDPRVPGGLRPNLVATIKGRSSLQPLWIISHTDVVPPGEASLWSVDPWKATVRDGFVYGRGVEDNHQGLVASVAAALAFVELGIAPARDIKLLFVADEEVGSAYGMAFLMRERELFLKGDLVLIPDGGKEDASEIEVAEKNLLWLKLRTEGKQTHGSRPDQGRNALLAGSDLLMRLARLGERFPDRDALFDPDYSTFSPTKKEANVPNVNTIPGDDVFYMDMRVLPRYPLKLVLEAVDEEIAAVEAAHGVKIARETIQQVESKATSADAEIVTRLKGAIKEVYGVEARPIGIGGGTVGSYLRNAGIDCVVWGKIAETAHQPDERVAIADIIGDAKVMALLAL